MKIKLNNNYDFNGNSTGSDIDTLSIAVMGQDFDSVYMDSMDYTFEYSDYAVEHYDYEKEFINQLSKTQKAKYKKQIKENNLLEYNNALQDFTDNLKEQATGHELLDDHPLAKEIEEAENEATNQLRKEWLHGDYNGNFEGILRLANKKYNCDFLFNDKTDTLAIDNYDEAIEEAKEDGHITRKDQFKKYIQEDINSDSLIEYNKRIEETKKRKEEYKKTQEYQKQRAEEVKKELINKLK